MEQRQLSKNSAIIPLRADTHVSSLVHLDTIPVSMGTTIVFYHRRPGGEVFTSFVHGTVSSRPFGGPHALDNKVILVA